LHDAWVKRAQAAAAALPEACVERALAVLAQWSDTVPGSSTDAYSWEVQQPAEKRVLKAEYLASDALAASVFAPGATGVASAAAPQAVPVAAVYVAPAVAAAPVAQVPGPLFKVFVNKTQQGPYSLHELAQRIALGEVTAATKVWNMQWVPRVDQWKPASEMAEIAPLLSAAIPDPHDDIPDPE
jgi:hypothetical protein